MTEVYRQNDKDFIHALNQIRFGECDSDSEKMLQKRNFPESTEIDKDIIRLFSVNQKADLENERRFKEIEGKTYTFTAHDSVCAWVDGDFKMVSPTHKALTDYDKNQYNQFDKDCRMLKVLELKVGARVILIANQDFDTGLVNGSCGNVTKIDKDSVKVLFDNGEECWIERDTSELKNGKQVKVSRRQIPLRLAYGLTIHKAQGLTLDRVFIDFDRVFAEGQAYVALSRAKTLDGLYLKHFNATKIFANDEVKDFYSIIT